MVQNNPGKPRGRPRAYHPETALAQATETFWQAGYSATSMDHLSAATGMNRPSLYGAFGDKHALYLATLDRYIALSRAAIDQALDYERPVGDALKRFYEAALSMYLPAGGPARGCFLIGTALAEAVNDPEMRAKLRAGLQAFDQAIEARLKHAQVQGELDAGTDPAALADIASGALYTLAIRSRTGYGRASLRATIDAAVQMICGSLPPARAAKIRKAGAAKRR